VFDREAPPAEAGDRADSAAKGKGNTLIALDQATGDVLWRVLDDPADCSSPVLIRFGGRDQLLVQTRTGLVGVDPNNGELIWRQSWSRENAFTTPIWTGDGLVFCTTGMDNPGRVFRLLERDGAFSAEEVWSSSKIKCVVSTPVRMGDYLVGGTGANPGFLVAVNMQNGDVTSRKRGYDVPTIIRAGEKLIILSQDGLLALATLNSGELTIQSSCKITERYSFSMPALVQTKLYVRDRKHIMAFDLAQ
jgi:outer membrane protein assembly factor BamB